MNATKGMEWAGDLPAMHSGGKPAKMGKKLGYRERTQAAIAYADMTDEETPGQASGGTPDGSTYPDNKGNKDHAPKENKDNKEDKPTKDTK